MRPAPVQDLPLPPLLYFGFWSGVGHTFSRPPDRAPDAVHRIYHAIEGRLSAYRLRRTTPI
ncbi:MAG TPA: hypothetical protein VFR67_11115 [Pilimelia sp.]|nr:hypothetical protein [Pilimelia sp.]